MKSTHGVSTSYYAHLNVCIVKVAGGQVDSVELTWVKSTLRALTRRQAPATVIPFFETHTECGHAPCVIFINFFVALFLTLLCYTAHIRGLNNPKCLEITASIKQKGYMYFEGKPLALMQKVDDKVTKYVGDGNHRMWGAHNAGLKIIRVILFMAPQGMCICFACLQANCLCRVHYTTSRHYVYCLSEQ